MFIPAIFGDVLSSLPAVRQLGGGEYALCPYPFRAGGPREPMTSSRAAFLLPLLKAQPYITDARFEHKPEKTTHSFLDIRLVTQKIDAVESLSDWHARHIGITDQLDTSSWLKAEPLREYAGKVVVARSERYRNDNFPWTKILQKHRGNLIFVGTRSEHHILSNRAHFPLQWAKCNDALHMAQIIAGASHFYGNQSFPLWVAMGVGVPFTQENWGPSPDTRIQRANGRYIIGGKEQNREFFKTL